MGSTPKIWGLLSETDDRSLDLRVPFWVAYFQTNPSLDLFHTLANSRHRQADRNSLCDKAGAAVEPPLAYLACQMCWALGGQLGADCLGIGSSLQVEVHLLSGTHVNSQHTGWAHGCHRATDLVVSKLSFIETMWFIADGPIGNS